MEWQRWHVAPGPRRSQPHNSWPTWNGGEPTITLCVPMYRYGWRSCSHENEVASFWRNATGSVLQRWQRGEPTDGGQCGKCSIIPCHWCHSSHVERECSEETTRELAVGGI